MENKDENKNFQTNLEYNSTQINQDLNFKQLYEDIKIENLRLKKLLEEKDQENEKLKKLNDAMGKLIKKISGKSFKRDEKEINEIDFFIQETKSKTSYSYFQKEKEEKQENEGFFDHKLTLHNKENEFKSIKSDFQSVFWQKSNEVIEIFLSGFKLKLMKTTTNDFPYKIKGLFEIEQEICNITDEVIVFDKISFSHSKSMFYIFLNSLFLLMKI